MVQKSILSLPDLSRQCMATDGAQLGTSGDLGCPQQVRA
jgi:hypothetical protein